MCNTNYCKPEPGSKARDDVTAANFLWLTPSIQPFCATKRINQFFSFSMLCFEPIPTSDFSLLTTGFGGIASPWSAPSRIQLCCREGELCHAQKQGVQEHCLQPPPPACFFIYVFICPLQLPCRALPCSCMHGAIPGLEELGLPCPQWDMFRACWPVALVTSDLCSKSDGWEGSEEVRCGSAAFSASNNSNSGDILFSTPIHGWKTISMWCLKRFLRHFVKN